MSSESREGGAPALGGSVPSESRYRGRMCSLPDDFLRVIFLFLLVFSLFLLTSLCLIPASWI
jgi:hypothetical protein